MNGLKIKFYLNDQQQELLVSPGQTALTCIREQLGLIGAKEVCAEGDCGACTIAVGAVEQEKITYRAINSCLLPASKMHGKHILTIEGLANSKELHPLQQAMVDLHAIQCGYCTSGFVMSLFCLFANNQNPTESEVVAALEGNLCRCTGYSPMLKVAANFSNSLKNNKKIFTCFFPQYLETIKEKLTSINKPQVEQLPEDELEKCENYLIPTNVSELFASMQVARNDYKIINGGTDLMVAANLHDIYPKTFIDISQIDELNFIREERGKVLVGGAVTLAQLQHNSVVAAKIPALQNTIKQMASTQIRNMATLAGNIANASPIADTACLLLALDATIILLSPKGERKVALANFYRDYKITELDPKNEIIARIEIPFQLSFCHFEKTAKRRVLDISTLNSAVNCDLLNNNINSCRIAFGGVAKYPRLAEKAAAFLVGKEINTANIQAAAAIAATEFQAISDVRGSAEYRQTLIYNHIIKTFMTCVSSKVE